MQNHRTLTAFAAVALTLCAAGAAAQTRWQITDGGKCIAMEVTDGNIPHHDHIEMSGEQVSEVLRWGIDPLYGFVQERTLVFPMLRTLPNDTHGSLLHCIPTDIVRLISVDGYPLADEKVAQVAIDGTVRVQSRATAKHHGAWEKRVRKSNASVGLTRTFFVSPTLPAACEKYEVRNLHDKAATVCIPEYSQVFATDSAKGRDGSYIIRGDICGSGTYTLAPGQSVTFHAVFQAYRAGDKPVSVDAEAELAARMAFITEQLDPSLVLTTPDPTINTAFRYAKIRGAESIFRTRGGLMHSPGGERFYAAMWANDQAEYINPFFPFLGYDKADSASLNTFRHFARCMNDEGRPMPSSIIAEGDDTFSWKGDRGDGAMVAYGAARYALARGDAGEARELWPLIEWCLEFCRQKTDADGVITSDSDELEERFPSGDANLCTSTLYYDALLSAAYLGADIGIERPRLDAYRKEAARIRAAIEEHFGANVGGYETYRYYEGCTLLRSWMCIPLTAGIFDRAEGTIDALFSPEMMTDDGVLTQQGTPTFWDRATLYALRGACMASEADKALPHIAHYSARRLLGDHVPYPVEAYPEGNQRQLSAENGLYCRIFTEGIFGIRPTGLRSFDLTPHMPSAWDEMSLRHIKAFGSDFDIEISRLEGDTLDVTVTRHGHAPRKYRTVDGKTLKINLK